MIKAIVLDDEPPALDVVQNFCNRTPYIDLVKAFSKTEEALTYLQRFPVDLLFLDINMPSISGIEFRKLAPEQTMVIFTTAHSEFALEGFNLNAIDYLLKPFTYERFLQAAEKARAYYKVLYQQQSPRQDFLLVRVEYSLVKVYFSDIIFIEGLDDYLKIHLKGQKPVVTRMTMKSIIEKLPQSDFIRVHRSFIVPFSRIEAVRNKMIHINGEELPIGSSYEAAFFARFRP